MADCSESALDSLILTAVSFEPLHGYGILRKIRRMSTLARDEPDGSLYPTLYRLERHRLIRGEWGGFPNKPRARYYRITTQGRRHLQDAAAGRMRACRVAASPRLAWGMAFSVAAAPAAEDVPRIRSTDPLVADLIAQATLQSRTFRNIVEAIDQTDGIVYVEPGRCGHSVRACLVLSVTRAARFRMLRIVVDTRRYRGTPARAELMASIGHELRHALEVLADPALATPQALYSFYSQQGLSNFEGSFETTAAVRAGNQVKRELTSEGSNGQRR